MGKYRISGVPIVNNEEEQKLVGIITNRDMRFIQDYSLSDYRCNDKGKFGNWLQLELLLKEAEKHFAKTSN